MTRKCASNPVVSMLCELVRQCVEFTAFVCVGDVRSAWNEVVCKCKFREEGFYLRMLLSAFPRLLILSVVLMIKCSHGVVMAIV